MPSLWSAVADEPTSTALGPATLGTNASVIALPLLPLAPLQAEPGDQDGGEQERDHGGGNRRALAEVAAADGTLVAKGRHQMRSVHGAAARHDPDELEIGEGEQHRERHHH